MYLLKLNNGFINAKIALPKQPFSTMLRISPFFGGKMYPSLFFSEDKQNSNPHPLCNVEVMINQNHLFHTFVTTNKASEKNI